MPNTDLKNVLFKKYGILPFPMIIGGLILCVFEGKIDGYGGPIAGIGFLIIIINILMEAFGSDSYTKTSISSTKRCSSCSNVVSNTSRSGQNCPHCGAYWSSEKTSFLQN